MTTWTCKCGWTGGEPSLSDASELRSDGTIDRVHIAVCPECFRAVRRALERTTHERDFWRMRAESLARRLDNIHASTKVDTL